MDGTPGLLSGCVGLISNGKGTRQETVPDPNVPLSPAFFPSPLPPGFDKWNTDLLIHTCCSRTVSFSPGPLFLPGMLPVRDRREEGT